MTLKRKELPAVKLLSAGWAVEIHPLSPGKTAPNSTWLYWGQKDPSRFDRAGGNLPLPADLKAVSKRRPGPIRPGRRGEMEGILLNLAARGANILGAPFM